MSVICDSWQKINFLHLTRTLES